MRLISFATEDSQWKSPRLGIILNTNGQDSRQRLDCEKLFAPEDRPSNPLAWFDMDERWFRAAKDTAIRLEGDPAAFAEAREKGWLVPAQDAYWFAPVPRPGKIVCIGLNYRDHAEESGLALPKTPVIFSKFSSCVIAPGEPVVIPTTSEKLDYEAELAIVIGRHAKHVTADRAYDYVLGYTAFNDVTARDFQFGDGQWQRGKSCDTFAPMGQTIVTTDEIPDPHTLRITMKVNGEVMQDSNTNQLIFRVPELIEFITKSISLEPGDVIPTGTPAGVGFARKPPVFLNPGDTMEVEIERIGSLGNPIAAATS
jgi:2-keto-4-pentenoate hydratase/2-oxohepta-3-ene-1,7-dioic acid hydratase in catechol pathway